VVQFLRQYNEAVNNFTDAFEAAGLYDKLGSDDPFEVKMAATTALAMIDGYERRLNELPTPEISELTGLLANEQELVIKTRHGYQLILSALQAGGTATLGQAYRNNLTHIEAAGLKSEELVTALLAKYNIPDDEVNYRRETLTDESEDLTAEMDAEAEAIQTAMYAMMADRGITSVIPRLEPTYSTDDWSSNPRGAGTEPLSSYLADSLSVYYYCWDSAGQLILQDVSPTPCPRS
jgi:hypothetical protein